MQQRSQITLCKLLLGYSFRSSSKPSSGLSRSSLLQVPARLGPNSAFPSPQTSFLRTPISNPQVVPNLILSNLQTYLTGCQIKVKYSTGSCGGWVAELDVNKEVDMINLKFVEAREEIEMAMESKETVYFNEEAECARAAVKEVVELFEGLLGKLPESEKTAIQRSMGLKIEQLKAELQQLDD
ncbi:uncharacterized protein LOC110818135 [Carica papaya]|uniref:uncharacterized protein LOC110818135 n=1 Tax=Carica papaya TaxID=3649 RepID=UPI000B8CE0DF|nr:uncharacterized protein LOC110818135 [Carica papaya]XP_021902589.1 uncharacterized protein LOC110818135 [Carica papaya]